VIPGHSRPRMTGVLAAKKRKRRKSRRADGGGWTTEHTEGFLQEETERTEGGGIGRKEAQEAQESEASGRTVEDTGLRRRWTFLGTRLPR